MRITIRPVADQQREIDLTHRLVTVIAEELWRACGGNEHLNWLEAELHLKAIIGGGRTKACEAKPPIDKTPVTVAACPKQAIVEIGDPQRQSRSTRREGASVSRLRAACDGRSQKAASA